MGDGQIGDLVHADDAVEGAQLGEVVELLAVVEDLGGDFVLVYQIDHVMVGEGSVSKQVVVVLLAFEWLRLVFLPFPLSGGKWQSDTLR